MKTSRLFGGIYMFLEKINQDIKNAMKNKDQPKVNSLRYLKSRLQENIKSQNPKEEPDILMSYKKTLEKSLDIYKDHKGELDKIQYDLSTLCGYLPKQMTEEETKIAILEIKNNNNICNSNLLMRESILSLKGKADGKIISKLVKEIFN